MTHLDGPRLRRPHKRPCFVTLLQCVFGPFSSLPPGSPPNAHCPARGTTQKTGVYDHVLFQTVYCLSLYIVSASAFLYICARCVGPGPPPQWYGPNFGPPPAVREMSPQITDTIGDFGQNWAQKGPPKAPTKAQISQISATRAPSHPPTPKTSPKQAKINKISATRGPGPQRGRGQTTGGEARATHHQANQRQQGPAATGGRGASHPQSSKSAPPGACDHRGRGSSTEGARLDHRGGARRQPTTHHPSLGGWGGVRAPRAHIYRGGHEIETKK